MKCNDDKRLFITNGEKYCVFDIYVHYVEAIIERIIWIAFYKNDKNNSCLIKNLPKDIIKYILTLLGKKWMVGDRPHVKITI